MPTLLNVISIQKQEKLSANVQLEWIDQIEQDFDASIKENDMLFMAMPDVSPMQIQGAAVEVAAVQSRQSLLKATVGVCELTTETGEGLSPDSYISEIVLSRNMLRAIKDNFIGLQHESDWLSTWEESLKISTIKPPSHGVIEGRTGYQPNPNYFGKDSVDLLVEGKTEWGQPFAITVRYYIHVIKSEKMQTWLNEEGAYARAYKQLCGPGKGYWRISTDSTQSELAGVYATDFLSTWQTQSQLSALIASATQSLTGFQALSGTTLGLTQGEGASATITLDDNAAGYGWYVDPTPLDNTDDYLPTADAVGRGAIHHPFFNVAQMGG